MADFIEKLILDDTGFINPLTKSLEKIKETEKGFEDLNKSVKGQQGEMGKQIVNTNKQVVEAQEKTIKTTRLQKEEFNKTVSSFKLFGVSLDDVKNKLTGYYNGLKGGLASMGDFAKISMTQKRGIVELSSALGGGRGAFVAIAKGANIFKAALISTGIGALVIGLGSLIAFLTKTQQGMDIMARAGAAVGIVFAKITDLASDLGEKIFKAFENPKQAIKDFGQLLLDNVINRFKGVIDAIGAAGRAIGNILIGDFKAAGAATKDLKTGLIQVVTGMDAVQQEAAKDGIKGFFDDVKNAVVETDKLTIALQNLQKAKILFIKTESEAQAALEKYRNISKDTARTYKERTDAAIKTNDIEAKLTNQRLKLANEELRIIQAQNALAKNVNKDYEKEYQAVAKVNGIKVESYRRTVRMQETLNGLLKEQTDYLDSATESLRKMGAEWGLITEQQEFEFAKQKQISDLDVMRTKIIDIGESMKTDMSENLVIIDGLIQKIKASTLGVKFEFFDDAENDKFNIEQLLISADKLTTARLINAEKEVKDVEQKEKLKTIITLEGELDRLKILVEYGDKTTLEYQQQMLRIAEISNELPKLKAPEPDPGFWAGINDFEDLWKAGLEKIFGQEVPPELVIGLKGLVSNFANIANEASEIAINNIDKQLDKLSEKRSELEKDLNYELGLQAEGRAHNVRDKQKEMDELLAIETRLLAEKEKLSKKQQLADLRAETASQAAALITTSINLIKGATKFLGPIGLPIGIAASAAMFAYFAKTKADAFKATRLYTGANRVSDHFGFSDRNGDTDILGRGDGYRVVSSRTGRDTGVIISGREMIVPEKYSLENETFFQNLKMGRYSGIDLDSAVRFSQAFKESSNTNTTKVIERAVMQPQRAAKQRVLIQVGPKKYTVVTIDDTMKDGQTITIDI